tara:strand:+ start:1557 stop:2231 length:675 start_codon:yes stop_codon:yes gene_type:complete
MRKKKGPAFKMKSGNKTAFKMMGAKSPVKRAGAFVIDVDDMGKTTSKRVTYDEARAAEAEGKTAKYTNKDYDKRQNEEIKELGDNFNRGIKQQKNRDRRRYDSKTDPGFIKTQKIDALAQKEIEGKTLTTREKRMLEGARALGSDTDKSTKTPRSLVSSGAESTLTNDDVAGLGTEQYKGAVPGLPAYAREDRRYTGDISKNVSDYKKLSDSEFEKKYGYPKGK